ncbi:MAG: hypothetical protein ACYDEB_05740 [Dehalococcoidia bacterium]
MPSGWPPPDLQFVLMNVPSRELKDWVEAQGEARPASDLDAVLAATGYPQVALQPLYEANKLRARRTAVTWIRNAPLLDTTLVEQSLSAVDPTGESDEEEQFFRVWVDPDVEKLAIRIAYTQSRRLIRRGLQFLPVAQYGIATFVWREFDVDDALQQTLEVHANSVWTKRLVLWLLSLSPDGAGGLEVLDIRDNACPNGMCVSLGGTLTDGVAEIDDPSVPDDRAAFSAKAGRDLNEPAAKFGAYAHYPGRGRTIEYADGGRVVRFRVSQVDYSTVFSGGHLGDIARVFQEANTVGNWVPFP